jgi:hypothetical protein
VMSSCHDGAGLQNTWMFRFGSWACWVESQVPQVLVESAVSSMESVRYIEPWTFLCNLWMPSLSLWLWATCWVWKGCPGAILPDFDFSIPDMPPIEDSHLRKPLI